MAYLLSDREYLTFDDVLIRPSFSTIKSRTTINTSTNFLDLGMKIPIISANMDYVTGPEMAIAMWESGGFGVLHRFTDWPTQVKSMEMLHASNVPIAISLGVRDPDESLFRSTVAETLGQAIICIDVAHGDHEQVESLIKRIKSETSCKIIAGNVATQEGFSRLARAGADAIKAGIGPGSVCTTRTVAGVGVPQLSAIMEIDLYRKQSLYTNVQIIADGGIKSSGDIVKALAAGADAVMLGNLLAGAVETPSPVIEVGDGRRYRAYRGQSIFGTNGLRETPEGISGYVEEKGKVADILKRLVGGLRSGMSYVGASNLRELRDAEFIKVSNMSHIETNTRVHTL